MPKNEALAKVDAFAENSQSLWPDYVIEWTSWNHVRTLASLLAAGCFE